MVMVPKLSGAKSKAVSFATDYGTVKISHFKGNTAPSSSNTLIIVSHGFQIQPAAIAQSKSGLPCFGFFVPLGISLQRTRYDGWLANLASSFIEAPKAYATTGVPDLIVGAHYIEPEDKGFSAQLEGAIGLCDIAVLDDVESSNLGTGNYQQTASLPLAELLDKWPGLTSSYSQFLMLCCRARWPPVMSGGTQRTPSGLYTYNDDFKILLD